jgi:hypothetical protein
MRNLCEHMFVRTFSFTITEHDQERPWIVNGVEHQTVEFEDDVDFFAWAAERWPAERFTVQLDPWSWRACFDRRRFDSVRLSAWQMSSLPSRRSLSC